MAKKIYLDVNDTLINTLVTAYKRNNYVLEKLGLPLIKLEEFEKEFGLKDFDSLIYQWTGTSDTHKFMEIYDESRKNHKYQSLMSLNDIEQLNREFILSIITETSEQQLITKFNEAEINLEYFDNILHSVKKEEMIQFNESETGCYYIGDSIKDYYFSLKNKMKFIAVTTGNCSKEDFMEIGCSYNEIFKSMHEIKEYLTR